MREQKHLLETTEWDWIVIADGGRADVFEEIYRETLTVEGTYAHEPVHNGGNTFTATWFADMFEGHYDATLYHGGIPIHSFKVNPADYDERDHFSHVVAWEEFPWSDRHNTCPPEAVVEVVEENPAERGVVRFLQPHNPFLGYPDIKGRHAAAEYPADELREAYRDTYEWVLETIAEDLFPLLDGRVIVTADHGECFGDCGQYLHNVGHERHEHLTTVPWYETTV